MFAQSIQIGEKTISHDNPVFIIAEAGVAHFGSVENAKLLIDMAVEANADAVKFQIFSTDELVSSTCPEWQERLRSKELPYEAFIELKDYCERKGIMFLATAHEEKSFEFLKTLEVPAYKVGSGELENYSFLNKIFAEEKPVILSTGLHTREAIENIAKIATTNNNPNLILLHCNTAYPTPVEHSSLKCIWWLRDKFRTLVGYSDHTIGYTVPIAAVALGACVIEKHICLDKNTKGSQDCKVACDQHDLSLFVQAVRDTEAAIGHYEKHLSQEVKTSSLWARKSIVAARDLRSGEVITQADVVIRRPGTGISPADLDKVLGRRVLKPLSRDSLIQWDDIECQTLQEKSAF